MVSKGVLAPPSLSPPFRPRARRTVGRGRTAADDNCGGEIENCPTHARTDLDMDAPDQIPFIFMFWACRMSGSRMLADCWWELLDFCPVVRIASVEKGR